MGIHGSATCTLNFEGATGYLLGAENQGLKKMFVCMNEARLGTALQALGVADAALFKAHQYAMERTQFKATTGPKSTSPADPIICHADVRRMLMLQKVLIEGSRSLCFMCSTMLDERNSLAQTAPQYHELMQRIEYLTPICKGFVTEVAVETCINAIQTFGGHGFITESGVEQHLRDVKVTTLYEGTTGIQALDLLARKTLMMHGEPMLNLKGWLDKRLSLLPIDDSLTPLHEQLKSAVNIWTTLPKYIDKLQQHDPNVAGSVATEYLMLSGYVLLGYCWLLSAQKSVQQLQTEHSAPSNQAKLQSAQFYFERILPRTHTLAASIEAGTSSLYAIADQHLR